MGERTSVAVWLDGAHNPRARVGGKGQSLSRLMSLGAPVPPAFCVKTNAYRTVAQELRLPTSIRDVQESDLPHIRDAIESASLPAAMQDELSEHFQALGLRARGPLSVAVR